MVTVHVDYSSLQADSQPKLVGLVSAFRVGGAESALIKIMNRVTIAMFMIMTTASQLEHSQA